MKNFFANFRMSSYLLVISLLIALFVLRQYDGCWLRDSGISAANVLSGMLALLGFMFTSRTFIVFKMHEHVYSSEAYQNDFREHKETDSINGGSYDPLRNLDNEFAHCIHWCLTAVIAVSISAFLTPDKSSQLPIPELSRVASAITIGLIVATLIQMAISIVALNKNVGYLMSFWQKQAETPKEEQ